MGWLRHCLWCRIHWNVHNPGDAYFRTIWKWLKSNFELIGGRLLCVLESGFRFVYFLYSQYNDVRTLVKATVKLHFHGYPPTPGGWINASESCHDSWCDIVVDDSISVTVSLKYLEYQGQRKDYFFNICLQFSTVSGAA